MSKRNRGGPSATPSQPPAAPDAATQAEPTTEQPAPGATGATGATEASETASEQPTEAAPKGDDEATSAAEPEPEPEPEKPAVPGADTPPPTEPVLESSPAKTGFVRARVIGPGAVKCGRWYPEGSEGNFPASVVDTTPQLQKI